MRIRYLFLINIITLMQLNIAYGQDSLLSVDDFSNANSDKLRAKLEMCQPSNRLIQIQNDIQTLQNYRSILLESLSKNEGIEKELFELLKKSQSTNSTSKSIVAVTGLTMTAVGVALTGSPGAIAPQMLLILMSQESGVAPLKTEVHAEQLKENLEILKNRKCDLTQIQNQISNLRQSVLLDLNYQWHRFRNTFSFGTRESILVKNLYQLNLAEKSLLKLQLYQLD